jgi:hypothetical protein
MPSALSALQSWWQSTPAARALTADGKLWLKEAPEDTALPYATCFRIAEPVEAWTTATAIVRATVQVNCHAATAAAAEALAESLRSLLTKSASQPSGAPLEVGPGNPAMHALDDDVSLDEGEGLGPGGSDCWVAFFTLEVFYTR